MRMALLATFFILVASSGAQSVAGGIAQWFNLPSTFCSSLFSPTTQSPLAVAGNYTTLLGISLLVVLVVLTVLGLVYGFGVAFKVDSLKSFARSEYLESFFNIVLIVLIGSGLAFAGSAISFIANLGLAGTQAITSQAGAAQAVQVSTVDQVYGGICNNYVYSGINVAFNNLFSAEVTSFVLSELAGMPVKMMPGGIGVRFSPLLGTIPMINVINTQIMIFEAIAGLLLAITFFLYIVYSLFPVFLYAGILLRSFPWTRAAGGAFIALFIAFYIVFPAILYPFTIYMGNFYSALGVNASGFATFSFGALLEVPTALLGSNGTPMLDEMDGFAQTAGLVGLQLMGVLIGLVVSFDLVEAIGKLLGAPSAHSRTLLGKLL